ncbi:acyltransferase family protein [Saccharothrix luteola]|uniref:acyltransferase family protein n=1 Tax=Saccharothrix luteola TaxID=2893018 RepID=UPI001E5D94F5|nr:acyltransferase family protein [Saccharothrix luteola]MCC8247249.1 acyltransferase [Saccharothrix luteola]
MALVTEEPSSARANGEARPAVRVDIQGMRALAVGLVICYHLRPEWLPGGFVGVDVFFVLSGFLIIGTLTGEVRRTGRVGLLDFYARRIRRLLPAATVVLLAVTAAVIAVLPQSRWPTVLREVLFSAVNAQNWLLAVLSNDYGHATVGASPVQHFWSLAVEEQFYLVIPLVLLVAAVLAARRGAGPVRYAVVAVGAITVASFAFSVWYTPVDPGAAYFVTPTRMWELGIGGLAAMALHRLRPGRVVRVLLGWGGLVAVLASAFWFTTGMAFPGWIAALPTVGTAAMLLARDDSLARVLGLRPLTYVGDISYSLYLWHWPVIVFVLEFTGREVLDRYQVVFAGSLSLVLAALSKHFVEDPFRRRKRDRRRVTYGIGAAMVAVTVAVASGGWASAESTLAALRGRSVIDADHPGALALDPTRPVPARAGIPLAPDPAVAGEDGPLGDLPGDCNVYDMTAEPSACTYGAPEATKTAVIVGDSHAAQFSSALAEFVRHEGAGRWRVKVVVRNGCPFTAVPPSEAGTPLAVCSDENLKKLDLIRDLKPDLVVTAAMSPESYRADLDWTWESPDRAVEGYRTMLTALSDAAIPVAVIRELPRPARPVVPCLERRPDDPADCDTPRARAVGSATDPLADAATGLPGVRVVDLTDWICRADTCPAVVGNVVVYRDNHLTDTYVRSLADPLLAALGLR